MRPQRFVARSRGAAGVLPVGLVKSPFVLATEIPRPRAMVSRVRVRTAGDESRSPAIASLPRGE